MKSPVKRSIRLQLLASLLAPLCALWLISAAVAYYLAVSFANDEYDHQLVNSADSVAARIKSDGANLLVDLPPAAQAILRHNDRDKFYFQILRPDGSRISGDATLPGPISKLDSDQPVFRYASWKGSDVRIARVRVNVPNYPESTVLVQVAETLNSRHQLAQHILMSILIPQLVLIALGALAVWHGVSKGLAPLRTLEQALAVRSESDLTQLPNADVPVEIQPLTEALNSLLRRLTDHIDSQKRFVANAAHQFRTPLAALKTYVYYAKRLPSNSEMHDVLDKIDSGTERMSHLSNKLLALAKAEPTGAHESDERVDLAAVASEVTASFVAEAARRNVELSFLSPDSVAIVRGDPHNLRELTANLVENAVFYTPAGGSVSVSISAGKIIRLSVTDTGPGIPPEERSRVFERFYRILGEVPGSGLGLAIVKEISNSHNAEVFIDTPPVGAGTVVTVAFPSDKKERVV